MDKKPLTIAIDGPAAAGKGTLARSLADRLDFAYLDTGALYRAVGVGVLEAGGDPANEAQAIAAAQKLRDSIGPNTLENPALRTHEAGAAASKASQYQSVRDILRDLQTGFAAYPPEGKAGAVLDGRDIGTVIAPDAPVKFFITASIEARAQRRFKELQNKGEAATYEAVLKEMRARDARDSERSAAPLRPADDACILDTSDLDAGAVLDKALAYVKSKTSS